MLSPEGSRCPLPPRRHTAWPMLPGAGQEGGVRPGTENVPGIVGLGVACELAGGRLPADGARLAVLRDTLWEQLRDAIPEMVRHTPVGHPAQHIDGLVPRRPRRGCAGRNTRAGSLHRVGVPSRSGHPRRDAARDGIHTRGGARRGQAYPGPLLESDRRRWPPVLLISQCDDETASCPAPRKRGPR